MTIGHIFRDMFVYVKKANKAIGNISNMINNYNPSNPGGEEGGGAGVVIDKALLLGFNAANAMVNDLTVEQPELPDYTGNYTVIPAGSTTTLCFEPRPTVAYVQGYPIANIGTSPTVIDIFGGYPPVVSRIDMERTDGSMVYVEITGYDFNAGGGVTIYYSGTGLTDGSIATGSITWTGSTNDKPFTDCGFMIASGIGIIGTMTIHSVVDGANVNSAYATISSRSDGGTFALPFALFYRNAAGEYGWTTMSTPNATLKDYKMSVSEFEFAANLKTKQQVSAFDVNANWS
ncbi:hypothetical protein AGMMS49975_29850 [Clostridia bacterium]|nr:hypothetical protein AGMMS49975_29850 [Clostridia bacterium]